MASGVIRWSDGTENYFYNNKLYQTFISYFGGFLQLGNPIDIQQILERLDISPDWQNWTEEEKFIVRLALP